MLAGRVSSIRADATSTNVLGTEPEVVNPVPGEGFGVTFDVRNTGPFPVALALGLND
ncbi:MAG: hypothetical protein ACYCXA_08910 [Actinomycetes bacterium]